MKRSVNPGVFVYPEPVVMVSCGDFADKNLLNIITVAWTGIINSEPPRVYVSVRPGRYSYGIIKQFGEFVINIATESLVSKLDFCGVKSGRDVDKFAQTGLTPAGSSVVNAPSVGESPLSIECTVEKIVPLGTHDMFLGNVVAITADEKYITPSGEVSFNDMRPVCYSNGEYFGLGKLLGEFGFSAKNNA